MAPAWLRTPAGLTLLRRASYLVLAAGVLACVGEGGSTPADPVLLPPGATSGDANGVPTSGGPAPTSGPSSETGGRVGLPGFGEVAVEVRSIAGDLLEFCLLLAETAEQRQRGLMTVTDPSLGGYDGMLFRFEDEAPRAFYMRNTPTTLTIAYAGADGVVDSVVEMAPCDDRPDCPTYPSTEPATYAVEVPVAAGGVARLGLEPGAQLTDLRRACLPTT